MAKLSPSVIATLDTALLRAFSPSVSPEPYTPDLFAEFAARAPDLNADHMHCFDVPKAP